MIHDENRRRHKRYPIDNLAGTLYVSADARIVNMSLTGMAIESASHLRPGNRYSIELADDKGRLRLPAAVRWCHLEGTRATETGETLPVYQAGLSFKEVLSDKAHEILGVLKEHVTIELERRLFGRFQLREERSAKLSQSHELVIKTLSLAGMLVLTKLEPDRGDLVELEIPLQGDQLAITGRVAHTNPIANPTDAFVAEVGIEFLDPTAEDRRKLEAILIEELE